MKLLKQSAGVLAVLAWTSLAVCWDERLKGTLRYLNQFQILSMIQVQNLQVEIPLEIFLQEFSQNSVFSPYKGKMHFLSLSVLCYNSNNNFDDIMFQDNIIAVLF